MGDIETRKASPGIRSKATDNVRGKQGLCSRHHLAHVPNELASNAGSNFAIVFVTIVSITLLIVHHPPYR